MAGNKTRDGIKISKLVKILEKMIPNVEFRSGGKHVYVANYSGMRPCPIATSTDARRMVTPWVAKITGYEPNKIYNSMKTGKWYN